MSLAIVYSRAVVGVYAPLVTVEVHLSGGLPGVHIVGLPETAVKESKERVRSALMNSLFEFPYRRLTVNLAPADLPKEGGHFDLAIALGILVASKQLDFPDLHHYEFMGEVALTGELRPVKGILPVAVAAKNAKRQLIVPYDNQVEAGLINQEGIFAARHLLDVYAHLKGTAPLPSCRLTTPLSSPTPPPDLADVEGQQHAKRALEIAAAGRHNLLFIGPPGTGKTMLANRLVGITPSLTEAEALEVATVASISHQGFNPHTWRAVPYRAPHHSSSMAAVVGGGRPLKPGEISLAHRGILFLDELPEFNRQVLEALREPLESGHIVLSRAAHQATFPADFQLIAAMNPCPCGFFGLTSVACRCTAEQIGRYTLKLSGPLLDRIDMCVYVPPLLPSSMMYDKKSVSTPSALIKAQVDAARTRQYARQTFLNQHLSGRELEVVCRVDKDAVALLQAAMQKFTLSLRIYHRLLRVARTIADLAVSDTVTTEHIGEALTYRSTSNIKSQQTSY